MMMSILNHKNELYTTSAACAEAFSGCSTSRSAMHHIAIIMDAVLASIFVVLISVIIVRDVVVISILVSIIVVSIIVVSIIILITVINSNYTPRYRGHA